MDRTLAERTDGGAGDVSTCDCCDAVRLRWDGVSVALKRERFLELARVLSQAAARLNAAGTEPAPASSGGRAWTH
jgi:hypothetical protein